MMNSLYLEKENQVLLWNMIHKNPQIQTLFSGPQQKEKWFNQIIMEMHEKQPNINDKDQLLSINRNTITRMMSDMKQKLNSYSFELNPKNVPTVPSKHINGAFALSVPESNASSATALLTSATTRLEARSNNYANAYEMRQKEYDSMLKVVLPPPIRFEQIEDKKIENMKELTEKYIQTRDLEIPQNPPSIPPQESEPKIQLKINESLAQEVLNENIKSLPKQVHWEMDIPENTTTTTKITHLENEIKTLNATINTMHSILLDLKDTMNQMYIQLCKHENTESHIDALVPSQYSDIYETQSMIEKIQKIASTSDSADE